MPTFIVFLGLATALALTLAVIILLPWFGRSRFYQADNQLLSLNISVFKQRLAELDDDYQQGQIEKTTYDNQKLALERQLLDISKNTDNQSFAPNWKSRAIFLIWIPFLAGMAYFIIGDRTPVYQLWKAQDNVGQVADDLLTGKIDAPPASATKDSQALVNAMQTNVHHHANDPERWFRLSEVFMALQAPEQAIEALSRAYRLKPDDEQVAITLAQTRFFTQGGQMDAETQQITEHLLAKNPNHQGAQMLMAMGEMRNGNYTAARKWVGLIKTDIQARTGDHSQALQSLAELEKTIDEREQQAQNAININVAITPELLGKVKKGDSLFVSVKPLAGGAPVAAKKLSADGLGQAAVNVKLSDNDSIMPTMALSTAMSSNQSLVVTARVSRAGDAMPQSGELTSNPVPLDSKATQLMVLIDKVVP